MSQGQDLMIQSSMPLSRGDEPDTAMPVLVVYQRMKSLTQARAASKLAKPSCGHVGSISVF